MIPARRLYLHGVLNRRTGNVTLPPLQDPRLSIQPPSLQAIYPPSGGHCIPVILEVRVTEMQLLYQDGSTASLHPDRVCGPPSGLSGADSTAPDSPGA